MRQKEIGYKWWGDPRWNKLLTVSIVFFFVYLGDAILSDWVPSYMQSSLGGPLAMGIVMSFSSIIGLGADVIFPQLLKGTSSARLMTWAIGASLLFSGILLWIIQWPLVILFLVAMAVWGIYYELLGFGKVQFVTETVSLTMRSGSWAVIGIFKSLAYFLGPIIGSWLALGYGNSSAVIMAAGLVLVGYVAWRAVVRQNKHEVVVLEKLNIVDEIEHWWILLEHIWPILLVSLTLGLIDATFWTTGTVFSDNLARQHWLGGMFLPFYMLPPLVIGVILAKLGIYKGKKKLAEVFMLLGGLFLALLGVGDSLWLMLLASLGAGVVLSVAWPLTEAVYSDIIARMGRERKHMMGLAHSTVSLAYIIGPVAAGLTASLVGERLTFVVVGFGTMMLAVFLLIVTPKKLRLPQAEIMTWKD